MRLSSALLLLIAFSCTNTGAKLLAEKTKEGVTVTEGGKGVLFYQFMPQSVNGLYTRAGFVHPLFDLWGDTLTENAPEDHPNHRGVFWAWHQVTRNGKKVADGWMSENIRFEPVTLNTNTNNGKAHIDAQLNWVIHSETGKADTIIRESTAIVVYPAADSCRRIDFDITLTPLADSIALGGSDDMKGYGGFCLRVKLSPDVIFRSGDTVVEPQETAVYAKPWMDITGISPDSHHKSGIAILAYQPAQQPCPWILRTATSMQNVPFPGRKPAILPPAGWHLKYSLLVHARAMDDETLQRYYSDHP